MKIKSIFSIIAGLIAVILLISCKKQISIKSINIVYVYMHTEYYLPMDCGMLIIEGGNGDTITLNQPKLLQTISQLIENLDSCEAPYGYPDIRIQCHINYSNGSKGMLCFGSFYSTYLNGTKMCDCDSLTYLIKKQIGYYEKYRPKEYLEEMPEYWKFKADPNP